MNSLPVHRPPCVADMRDLRAETYYRMGGTARYFALPRSVREMRDALLWAQSQRLPIACLGSGSNSVFADGLFEGLVLGTAELNAWHWEAPLVLYVEAGVSNTEVAEICLAAGVAGATWMYRMPGQLGATIRMNARCYGGEISQIVLEVLTLDKDGNLRLWEPTSLFRGYKDTALMTRPEVVLAARLRLPGTDERKTLLTHMEQCERDRHGKHHFDWPSCGSTFKNNYAAGKPSGRIFDELGLKGTTRGEAAVSEHHANFVWNKGSARSSDMLALAASMRAAALAQTTPADLELEVQPIGLFDRALHAACAMERLGPCQENPEGRWCGLLWHPEEHPGVGAGVETNAHPSPNPTPNGDVERELLRTPFLEYFRTPHKGVVGVTMRLVQCRSLGAARAKPEADFLRWETWMDADVSLHEVFSAVPPAPVDSFVDGLWSYSVSELFLASADIKASSTPRYLEFEMTPDLHWVALSFEGVRNRAQGHDAPRAELWPGLRRVKFPNGFGMVMNYATVAALFPDDGLTSLDVQGALSLGRGHYYLAPHWKSPAGKPGAVPCEDWDLGREPIGLAPNFHQPGRYWRVNLF